jgi:hypothetical protein
MNAYAQELKKYAQDEAEKLIAAGKNARDAFRLPKSDSEIIQVVKEAISKDYSKLRYMLNGAPQCDSDLDDSRRMELIYFYMDQYMKTEYALSK